MRYPELNYTLSHFNVDFIPYPTSGYMAELSLRKTGLSKLILIFGSSLQSLGYWHLGKIFF